MNKKSFINQIKKGIGVGSISAVGKSAAVQNAAIQSDTDMALLKNKLGMESIKARAANLGQKVLPTIKSTATAGKIGAGAGLLAVGAAGALGVAGILHAKKKFDKAIDEQNAASQRNVTEAQKLSQYLKKKKAETGMSYIERRKGFTQEAGPLTDTLKKTLMKEAPETLRTPIRSQFSSDQSYNEAVRKFNKNKNWATK